MIGLAFLFLVQLASSNDVHFAPGLPANSIHIPGDLLIAAILNVNSAGGGCEDDLDLTAVENSQLLVEAIDAVNNNASILGGVRLGVQIYDHCYKDRYALAQAVQFLPRKEDVRTPYITMICCEASSTSVLVADLMTAYEIPQIGTISTSDVLSDKTAYEYFMRTITPDRFQVQAILDVIESFGWSYVAVLFSEGVYGENLMRRFEKASENMGTRLCIGYRKEIYNDISDKQWGAVVDELISQTEIHVLVMLLSDGHDRLFLSFLARNVTDRFVWLGSDGWWGNLKYTAKEAYPVAVGGLSLMPWSKIVPQLYSFLTNPSKALDARNVWLNSYWETRFNCLVNTTCNFSALVDPRNLPLSSIGAYFHDALAVVVEGLTHYLPTISYNVSRFSNKALLSFMKSVKMEGINGPIVFDENGDLLGSYTVLHGIHDGSAYRVVEVGSWSAQTGLQIDVASIQWFGKRRSTPEAVCSKPCAVGYIQIAQELVCCWHCYRCRENEITNENRSSCVQCPMFTWPNPDNLLECDPILPGFVGFADPTGLALLVVALIGILLSIFTISSMVKNNSNLLIKSCCREASFVLLVGICLHFLLLFSILGKPTYSSCMGFRFGFHLTCTAMYSPIVIKILKIFRIFTEGKRSTQRPKFIGWRVQVIIIAAMISVEACLVGISVFVQQPYARTIMASPFQPVVEVLCDESIASICIGLMFNFMLILGCACLAFKARKLPDNYNESSQVGFSVGTAIIMWLVFVPSFSSTQNASRRFVTISLAIIINGFVLLVGLFFPKLYAVYFIDEANFRTGTNRATTRNGIHPSTTGGAPSMIFPVPPEL